MQSGQLCQLLTFAASISPLSSYRCSLGEMKLNNRADDALTAEMDVRSRVWEADWNPTTSGEKESYWWHQLGKLGLL